MAFNEEKSKVSITGLDSKTENLLFLADYFNCCIKEFKLSTRSFTRVYQSDWCVAAIKTLKNIEPKQDLIATMECKTERNSNFCRVRISQKRAQGMYVPIQENFITEKSGSLTASIVERGNGHILCAFPGFTNVYEIFHKNQTEKLPILKSHPLPGSFFSMCLARINENEHLIVSLSDRTVRDFVIDQNNLKELSKLDLPNNIYSLYWDIEKSVLLVFNFQKGNRKINEFHYEMNRITMSKEFTLEGTSELRIFCWTKFGKDLFPVVDWNSEGLMIFNMSDNKN